MGFIDIFPNTGYVTQLKKALAPNIGNLIVKTKRTIENNTKKFNTGLNWKIIATNVDSFQSDIRDSTFKKVTVVSTFILCMDRTCPTHSIFLYVEK